MEESHNESPAGPDRGTVPGKRPLSLWIIPVFLLLAGLAAFATTATAPSFIGGLARSLGFLSALVQAGAGALLLRGKELGRRVYLVGAPVAILLQAVHLGSRIGFTDDDYPIQALLPCVIYGVFAFFLTRARVRDWLARRS